MHPSTPAAGPAAATTQPGGPNSPPLYNGGGPVRNGARAASSRARVRGAARLKKAGLAPKCVETKITHLPPAEREEQLRRHGLDPSPRWSGVEGANRTDDAAANEFLREGGWGLVETARGSGGRDAYGAADAGMTAHRGVTHPDEYVDHERLVGLVEGELGFSYDDVHSVYRQGRLSDEQRGLRGRIDARLLELSRAGANMVELGRVLGLGITPDGHCRAIQAAVARAAEVESNDERLTALGDLPGTDVCGCTRAGRR